MNERSVLKLFQLMHGDLSFFRSMPTVRKSNNPKLGHATQLLVYYVSLNIRWLLTIDAF